MPIRYFVINQKTHIMHVFGLCRHTKPRAVPIRLFDSCQELERYADRPLRLCAECQRELNNLK